jgi:hypothetical protein
VTRTTDVKFRDWPWAWRQYILCNARDHEFGRCTLPAGHGSGRWHAEMRRGRLWASWRGPIPGERCSVCGTDHRRRLAGP